MSKTKLYLSVAVLLFIFILILFKWMEVFIAPLGGVEQVYVNPWLASGTLVALLMVALGAIHGHKNTRAIFIFSVLLLIFPSSLSIRVLEYSYESGKIVERWPWFFVNTYSSTPSELACVKVTRYNFIYVSPGSDDQIVIFRGLWPWSYEAPPGQVCHAEE